MGLVVVVIGVTTLKASADRLGELRAEVPWDTPRVITLLSRSDLGCG